MFLLQASSQTWFGVRSVNKLTTCVVVYEIMLVSISDLRTYTCLIIMDKLMYVIPYRKSVMHGFLSDECQLLMSFDSLCLRC